METVASLSRAALAGAPAATRATASRVNRAVVPAASRPRGGRLCCRRSLTAVSAAAGASPPVSPSPSPDGGSPGVWDALGGVSVLAAGTGEAVQLRDLWDPTEESMAKFDAAGAKLIAIGVGTPDKARILADGLPFPVDSLYADPERKAYDVLGLYHGLGRTLISPAKMYSGLNSIKKVTKNYTLKGTPADLTEGKSCCTHGKTKARVIMLLWMMSSTLAAIKLLEGFATSHAAMAAAAASTSLPVPRVSLPPSARPAAAPRHGLLIPGRRGCFRLRGSPAAPAAAASGSPSVPSSSPEAGSGIGDALGGVAIYSAATGEPVLFRDLWDQNEGMAVVALLRHFGCPCCWELASVLRDTKERFDSAGVKLIAVGVGTPDKARILAERLPFPLDYLYADPERKAYDLLGLYFGIGRTFFNPASASVFSRFDSLKEAVKNYTIEATPDDRASVLQQGGMFVFRGKELIYARKDEGTGDHAPLDDVLNICYYELVNYIS
uniref:Thioredoxin domain-containing protein n=1 Tax=Oryza nivara TaxID=4536 RepID=A0A0E0GT98_ORYNI